jgi:hypothetical protein
MLWFHVSCYALQLFSQEMEKRSGDAADPKKHENYIRFKKDTDELLKPGRDCVSALCGLLAFLVISLMFFPSHDAASTS